MEHHQASAEVIFEEALKLPANVRDAFVAQACQGNDDLHRRLLRLLEANDEAGTFLDKPVLLGVSVAMPEPHAASPDGEQSGDRIGRYKLLQKIGEGGCGVVYMAEQEEPVRRRVALKVIKLGMDTKQVVARFEAERQALALMDHPNIAKVLDAGATAAGRPFFVMELVKGIPATRFADENRLDTRQRLDLFIQICQAVQHAHLKGIIHRDIKPSNVLVADYDGKPVPKVIDFGIAKATTDQRLTDKTLFTAFQQFIGTPAYMSPEQAKLSGLDVDTRSDIYSLGVLLYELLTGRTPFDPRRLLDAGFEGIRRIIGEEEPPKPSTRLSTLDAAEQASVARHRGAEPPNLLNTIRGDLDWIVMKCLEKERARRYETASSLAADVQRHLSDEPVTACPPSRLYSFQRMVRRNRPAVIGVAAVATVLVLGVIVSTRLAVWAMRERASAEMSREESEQKARAEAKAKIEARDQRDRAELEESTSRERLVRLNVANGVRLLDIGHYFRALLWFHEALKNESPASERSYIHRLRLRAVLDASPKLVQILRAEGAIKNLSLSPDGKDMTVIYQDPSDKGKRRWQLFDVESGESRSPQQGHSDSVLAYDRNSSELLVASNGVMLVRNARTGESLTTLNGLVGPVDKAAISPGAAVVLVVQSNTVRVWSSRSGEPLTPSLTPPGLVDYAGFNHDGTRFVMATSITKNWTDHISSSVNGQVRVWDTRTGQPVMPAIELGDHRSVTECVFSPDGQLLLWVVGGELHGWILETGTATGPIILDENPASINQVNFGPDGRRFVTAHGSIYHRGSARVWEARTGKPLRSVLENGVPVNQAVFSPGGDLVATVSADHTARVWDVENSSPLTPQLCHEADIVAVTFAPDGRRLITGTAAGVIRIWDLSGQRTPNSLQHGGRRVIHAEFSRDGESILTACYDGKGRLWGSRTNKLKISPLEHPPLNYKGGLHVATWATFSPDESRLLTVGGDLLKGTDVRVWDGMNGRELFCITNANLAKFSPEGRWIATASENVVRLWDADTGAHGIQLEHSGYLRSIHFSSDGTKLLTVGRDKKVRLRNVSDGREVGDLAPEDGIANRAVFTPDGSRVAIACEDGTIRFRDGLTGRLEPSFPKQPTAVNELSFSRDGRKLLATSGALVRILDANSGQPLAAALQHAGKVSGASFSPDNKLVATWSHNAKKVWWWDAATGQPMGPPLDHEGNVDGVAFHPDSLRFLTMDSSAAYRWAFTREDRRLEDLELFYRLLASASIDESGSIVALNAEMLGSIWARLRGNNNSELNVSKPAHLAWYHERAAAFEAKCEWSFAVFYLKRLVETNPTDLMAKERLVAAESELGKSKL